MPSRTMPSRPLPSSRPFPAPLRALSLLGVAAALGCDARPPASTAQAEAPVPVDSGVARGNATAPVTAGADSVVATAEPAIGAPPADDSAAVALARRVLGPSRGTHDRNSLLSAVRAGVKASAAWPTGPAPKAGAILPGKRIIAYYGNPHSKKMGVIGEYPEAQMLGMLDRTVAQWKAADPDTPVLPAIHLVAVVAQGAPGADGKWRRRETSQMIERTYGWAKQKKGILFLDIQASHSTLREELPLLLPYLERPDVHLGVDPEFYMHHEKEGVRPSAKIGQMRASDVNYVVRTLDSLVAAKNLPPKVLVVHRFQRSMLPDAEGIRPTANVQVVIHMDGWGPPWLKFDSYRDYIVKHPVQFTGFKIFYHNDTKAGDALLMPREVLALQPRPLYIQYQ